MPEASQPSLFDPRRRRYDELRAQAGAFHKAHPEVWHLFERFALEAIGGERRVGAKAIWERLRWETSVNPRYSDGDWKLNNNFPSFYARRFIRFHPEHAGFFVTRRQVSKGAA